MEISLSNVKSDFEGFNQLIALLQKTKDCAFGEIEVDLAGVTWFEANMCAPFGAILYKVSRELNSVRVTNVHGKLENILLRNGFLSNYGRAVIPDRQGTTIKYKRLETKDARFFGSHIDDLLTKSGIPKMSTGLFKKFRESIFEIFSNAVIHSETKLGIFSCGQVFPNKHRLDFSIADLGMGIRQNVRQNADLDLTAEEAINWALEGKNTTKKGPIPGGLGLKLLREFIELNKGRIQIVSDKGYWDFSNGESQTRGFLHPFPGTVVNIEINTADERSYCLASEINPKNIF